MKGVGADGAGRGVGWGTPGAWNSLEGLGEGVLGKEESLVLAGRCSKDAEGLEGGLGTEGGRGTAQRRGGGNLEGWLGLGSERVRQASPMHLAV